MREGENVAAAQEEHFNRKKRDARFPGHAIARCLEQADIALTEADELVFYCNPQVIFKLLLETY